MKASAVTFDQMMQTASGNFTLAEATSFIQVEFGIVELHAAWDGFVDTSNNYNVSFQDRKDVCNHFANALTDYIEYLEPLSQPLGH